MHYSPSNTTPENLKLIAQLRKMFGEKAQPDLASVGAWGTALIYQAVAALGSDADGLKYVDFMKGKELTSPRGPGNGSLPRLARNVFVSSSTAI